MSLGGRKCTPSSGQIVMMMVMRRGGDVKFHLIFKGIDKMFNLPHLRGDQQFELSQRAQINITIFRAQCLEWDLNLFFPLIFC